MILRKPYAFFIKMFKPIHFILAALIAYLIVLENKIYSFLNSNMYSSNDFVGQGLYDKLVRDGLFVIPVILIILGTLILAIMFSRKKPYAFYVISIMCAIAILAINVYSVDFIKTLDETIVTLKSMKAVHDLSLIALIIEVALLVIMIIRGAGVNIKKFNFDSDLSKIDIKETDNEEFEVDIRFSLDETKRKKNKRVRYLKYIYEEKKLIVNIILVAVITFISFITMLIIKSGATIHKEGVYVFNYKCGFKVSASYLTNRDLDGKILFNDYYLAVVNLNMKKNNDSAGVYLNDFVLNVDNTLYSPTIEYNRYLTDLGNAFNENLELEYKDYFIVYKVPKNKINKKMTLRYNDGNDYTYVRLNPIVIDNSDKIVSLNLNENLIFDDKLKGITLTINDYDIKDNYVLNYEFCTNKNDCLASKEYIRAKNDQSFDKSVIRLDIEYKNDGEYKLSNFYDLLTSFGKIEYKIGDKTKYQRYNIEKIVSSKKQEKNIMYLGVNSEIKKADEVYFEFNLRDVKYRYKVK